MLVQRVILREGFREQSWNLDMSNSLTEHDRFLVNPTANALYTLSPECEWTSHGIQVSPSYNYQETFTDQRMSRKGKKKEIRFSAGVRWISNIAGHLSRHQTGTLRSRNRSKNCHIHSLVNIHAPVCRFFRFSFELEKLWCTKFDTIAGLIPEKIAKPSCRFFCIAGFITCTQEAKMIE